MSITDRAEPQGVVPWTTWASTGWVIALLTLAGIPGCDNEGSPVRIVVPRDFHGEFQIIEVPDAAEVPLRDGKYIYIIPKSGRLCVPTFDPFTSWHTESFAFDDGSEAMHYDHPGHSRSEELAIFGGGVTVGTHFPHPTQRYFVGGTSEARDWSR